MLFKAQTSKADRIIWVISISLLILLGLYQLVLALNYSPRPDDALVLSVPKNWINGYGWATSYSEKIPFNPDFTGPPTLLIPAALLMKWFGYELWIAGFTGAIINFSLLLLCLWQIKAYWNNAPLAILLLVCGVVASFPEDFSSLVGYYTGSLLFLLACFIAFNSGYSNVKRALVIGLLTAIGLLIKSLMAPAFMVLAFFFIFSQTLLCKKSRWPILVLSIPLPIVAIVGSWQVYKQHELAAYTPEFLASYEAYGREFFLYHGSGIGQWQKASDKWLYISRNVDKNLYFLEEGLAKLGFRNPLLGNEPADIHHIFGLIFIAAILCFSVFSIIRAIKKPQSATDWITSILSITIIAYVSWFLLLAMAMSPGHLYFPLQWVLWLFMLQFSRLVSNHNHVGKFFLSACAIIFASKFIPIKNPMVKPDEMHKAAAFIQKNHFTAPLAGCGYNGYPRHIEYLLPTSQNFSDCLDMIEDHVEWHEGRYRWKSPLEFTLVFSLQSPGINSASSMVFSQCNNKILYRNNEVFIFYCEFDDLQKIDLNKLMPEITSTHGWYKTRIRPLEK